MDTSQAVHVPAGEIAPERRPQWGRRSYASRRAAAPNNGPMNLSDLTRRVRQHLAEAGTGAYSNEDIAAQVIRSARDLARTYHLFRSSALYSTLNPDGHVTPPADLAALISVGSPTGGELPQVTPEQVALTPGTWATPAYAWGEEYDTGGDVLLYGHITLPVVLTYYRYPPDPTLTTDAPPGREAWGGKYPEYHDLISLHAAHSLAGLTGASAAKDTVWLMRFEQRKDEFRGYLATARIGQAGMRFTTNTRFPSRSYQ